MLKPLDAFVLENDREGNALGDATCNMPSLRGIVM